MKRIMVTLAILSIVGIAQAQNELGVEAGIRFANIVGEDAEGDSKIGFQVGVNYSIPLIKNLYIQPGISFVQGGTKLDDDFSLSTNYLQVPALVRYQLEAGNGSFFVGAGPYFGFGIGKVVLKYDGEKEKEDWDDMSMKKFDAGAKLQAGYQISNGLYFGIGFERGFTKVEKYSQSVYNSAFSITAGYRFSK